MTNRLRRWEAALMVGVAVAMLLGMWLDGEQAALAENVIRLHVIANSDSEEDQTLKLRVRDSVLAQAEELLQTEGDVQAARQSLEAQLPRLAQAGRQVVEAQGYDYSVTAAVKEVWFPTKQYEDFALPAGNYTALQIVIGEGSGRNWWCVVFPSLCLPATSDGFADTAVSAGFSDTLTNTLTGQEGYHLRFFFLECLGRLQNLFC